MATSKKFDTQNNYGWGYTFDMARKVPAVNKRIFDKYNDAYGFADDPEDTCIVGLMLSVVSDGDKNGIYFVEKIREKGDVQNTAILRKLGSSNNSTSSSNPDNETIGLNSNDELCVKILNKEGNMLSKETYSGETGLYATVPCFFEDPE